MKGLLMVALLAFPCSLKAQVVVMSDSSGIIDSFSFRTWVVQGYCGTDSNHCLVAHNINMEDDSMITATHTYNHMVQSTEQCEGSSWVYRATCLACGLEVTRPTLKAIGEATWEAFLKESQEIREWRDRALRAEERLTKINNISVWPIVVLPPHDD